jgi:hypothetical protein
MMSSAGNAASIAEVHPAPPLAGRHDSKRQRIGSQRCSNASDVTTFGCADAADTPAAGEKDAEQQEQQTTSGRVAHHADATVDESRGSPALPSARPQGDCRAMQPHAFYGPPHHSPGRYGSRQTAVELRIQRFLQVGVNML